MKNEEEICNDMDAREDDRRDRDQPDIEETENEDDLIFLDVSWAKTQENIYKPIIQQLLKEGWFPNQEGENNYGCFVVLKRNINKF